MTEITPEVIQAEVENLESIIPASDYHIILFPVPDKKTTSGIELGPNQIKEETNKRKGYYTIVKPNPNTPEVKVGSGLLPQMITRQGATRQEGMISELAGTFLPYPLPKTKGIEYLLVHHTQVLAFQEN